MLSPQLREALISFLSGFHCGRRRAEGGGRRRWGVGVGGVGGGGRGGGVRAGGAQRDQGKLNTPTHRGLLLPSHRQRLGTRI